MTVDEVLAQSVIFLIAGYETSSTTLGFVCYSLATNADIQEKLQKEIDSVWDDESKMPSYETVNDRTAIFGHGYIWDTQALSCW